VVPATTAAVTWVGDSLKQCNNHIGKVRRWHLTLVGLLRSVLGSLYALSLSTPGETVLIMCWEWNSREFLETIK
jgi:hypothetical protein